MKLQTIIIASLFLFSCKSNTDTPVEPTSTKSETTKEVTLIVECETIDNQQACDTFYAPENFIKTPYTKNTEQPEMSSYIHGAWDGNSYRFINTVEENGTTYFYYEKVENPE